MLNLNVAEHTLRINYTLDAQKLHQQLKYLKYDTVCDDDDRSVTTYKTALTIGIYDKRLTYFT